MPLKVLGWDDARIVAQVDPAFGGVPDLTGMQVDVQPNGVPLIRSPTTHSFSAARETRQVPLPPTAGVYAQIYAVTGALKTVLDGAFTRVERDFIYRPFCPEVKAQSQLVDVWTIDSRFYELGFDVVNVTYVNRTNQNVGDGDTSQDVLVGGSAGGAVYDASRKRVIVTFQAHSTYTKQHVIGTSTAEGSSRCTAAYLVSLTVSGPRGLSPFK